MFPSFLVAAAAHPRPCIINLVYLKPQKLQKVFMVQAASVWVLQINMKINIVCVWNIHNQVLRFDIKLRSTLIKINNEIILNHQHSVTAYIIL